MYTCLPFVFRHARKYFSSQLEEQQLKEIQTVMGLLAFSPDTHITPYRVFPIFEILSLKEFFSLVGRYFHNVYIVKSLKIVFSVNFSDNSNV